MDGRDIWPVITGQQSVEGSSRQIYWKTRQSYAVRDGRWKLLVQRNTNIVELYDMDNDFRETRDLSDVKPDIVEHMMALLEDFKKDDRE